MNILYLTNEYPPAPHGGIGNFVMEISEKLASLNHNVTVIGLYDKYEVKNINGVKVIRLKKFKFPASGLINLFILRRFIFNYIKKNKIDLVEDNDWDLFSSILKGIKCPLAIRIHNRNLANYSDLSDLDLIHRIKLKLSIRNVNSIISVSYFIANQLKRVLKNNNLEITNIYNGIEVKSKKFPENSKLKNTALFAGTLVEEKGIVNLVRAWNSVLKANKNSVLHICGKDSNGKMKNRLLSIVSNKDSLKFHGHLDKEKLYKLYKKCSLFISPSFFEAFSLVPLESMSNGCPTIYTKLSSGDEIIKNNQDGLLINPHNISEITNSILKIFNDEHYAKNLAINGFHKIKNNFDLDIIIQKNLNHYKYLIEKRA